MWKVTTMLLRWDGATDRGQASSRERRRRKWPAFFRARRMAVGRGEAGMRTAQRRMFGWGPKRGAAARVQRRRRAELKALVAGVRRGYVPDKREPKPGRVSAYEQSLKNYADEKSNVVIDPAVGISFDSLAEAFDFCNLYSWEMGFGIRWGASTKNQAKWIIMQEIVCCCQGKPEADAVTLSTDCKAMIQLHRSDDNGWYIKEYQGDHNHPLSGPCSERSSWPSHKHLDKDSKIMKSRILSKGVPVEEHAAKIYTRAMFEKFDESIFHSGSYVVDEKVKGKAYLVRHIRSDRRETWSQVEFEVTVRAENDAVDCECGLEEHMGMPCCHAVKVMIHLGMQEIPSGNIVKRWTMNARDVLPAHLIEYDMDRAAKSSRAIRFALLYIVGLEMAKLASRSEEAFEIAMPRLCQLEKDLSEHHEVMDRFRMAEQSSQSTSQGSDVQEMSAVTADDATSATRKRSMGTEAPDRISKIPQHTQAEGPQDRGQEGVERRTAAAQMAGFLPGSEGGHGERVRRSSVPDERKPKAGRVSAYEKSLKNYAEEKSNIVIDPAVGMSFDSLAEAFDFCNLYSWEMGFGIRWGGSTKNQAKRIIMQEIVCCCQGKPEADTVTLSPDCKAMIQLHRSDDNGWYIREFRGDHNHPVSGPCSEKSSWPSHKHLDTDSKNMVCHLRDNSVDLNKMRCVIDSFFGVTKNVLFDKAALKCLSRIIAMEHFQDDKSRIMSKGVPIEEHAAKIYTRAMFKKFDESIFLSGSYVVDEKEKGKAYLARYIRSDRQDMWSQVEFEVTIRAEDGAVVCECGLGEHMGMPCCHAVKVMIHLGMQEIPAGNIVKRWTMNARDVLPAHLIEYDMDKAARSSQLIRRSLLYVLALDMVKLGGSSAEAFETTMSGLHQLKQELFEHHQAMDDFGMTQQSSRSATQSSDVQEMSAATTDDATSAIRKRSMETEAPQHIVGSTYRPYDEAKEEGEGIHWLLHILSLGTKLQEEHQ
ncbi:hypothetical protein EJB05_15390, partial [Eragrostis curvula]